MVRVRANGRASAASLARQLDQASHQELDGAVSIHRTAIDHPLSGYDRACFIPALELYANGCVSFPGGDILLHCGLARLAEIAISDCDFPVFTVGTIERTRKLSIFLDSILTAFSEAPAVIAQVRAVLSYAARDVGQGVGASGALLQFACWSDDTDLLSVVVDSRTRQRSSGHEPREFRRQEQFRLHSVSEWSPISQRQSASIIHRSLESREILDRALDGDPGNLGELNNSFAPLSPFSIEFLNNMAVLQSEVKCRVKRAR